MIAQVIVDISNSEVDKVFDYFIPSTVSQDILGYRVNVPFGNRTIEGYVICVKETSEYDITKIKPIASLLDDYAVISHEMLELLHFMTAKYHLRLVDCLRLFIPSQMRGGKVKELKEKMANIADIYKDQNMDSYVAPRSHAQRELCEYLLSEPNQAVSELNKNFSASALRNLIERGVVVISEISKDRTPYSDMAESSDKAVKLTESQQSVLDTINATANTTFLLHGVTGSGKTEVYMHAILSVLKQGKTAIMLVPEISLTPQVLGNFRARFGDNVALLHSGLGAGERFDEWRRLLSGRANIAIGARSAIFAPLQNLGIIIIDEEHDNSYVSDSNPRYVTFEIAEFREKYNHCSLIMGSATPSIESFYNAQIGKYKLLKLPERINCKPMPHIDVVNMCDEISRGNNSIFSQLLQQKLKECIESDNQAIIFLNRRGYSSYVICKSCGYVVKCDQCDVSLVYHKEENVLKCHYCNNRYKMLDVCPKCKSPHIRQGYCGTEQVEETLKKMFPNQKILRMDNDTTQTKDAHINILSQFARREANILVGTQMIAKGHDFPDVTLVGIVDADMSLHFADYRSTERTFQLITQVAGRAGRDNKEGSVVLQTYSPNHYVYKYAVQNNYLAFYDKECNLREVTKYPPFSKIVRVLVTSEDEANAVSSLKAIYDDISLVSKSYPERFIYLCPMKSPVKLKQGKHRMQVLARIVGDEDDLILGKIYDIMDKNYNNKVSLFVETNPNNLS